MCDEITGEAVQWSTGQPPASADAVLWAIGRVRPNTDWLPAELLDEQGFVATTPQLQLPGHPMVPGARERRGRQEVHSELPASAGPLPDSGALAFT